MRSNLVNLALLGHKHNNAVFLKAERIFLSVDNGILVFCLAHPHELK